MLVVLVVGGAFAALQGMKGITPGKVALGLRTVHHGSGTPIGIVPSLVRTLVLGVAALPTFGLGAATLAWTAVMDRDRQRRGWHDHRAQSIVVDVRPVQVEEAEVDAGPRQIVNLTAMRLVPAPQQASVSAPARRQPPTQPAGGAPVQPPAPVAAPAQAPPPPAAPVPSFPSGPLAPQAAQPAAEPAAQPTPVRRVTTPGASTSERTIMRDGGSGGGLARWRVAFDTGEEFVVEGLALVGRRPEPRQGEPVRHLLPLPSSDMSLSKTHAQFQVAPDGVLVVMDRGSTNGTILVRSGVARELTAGKPTTLLSGDTVRFGDRQMTVLRES